MTDHVRSQIRDYVAGQLSGLTSTGTRVFKRRVRPLDLADLPCLLVRSGGEDDIERITIGFPAQLRRPWRLEIVVVAKAKEASGGDTDIDTLLETSIKEVEAKLASSRTIWTANGLVREGMRLVSVGDPQIEAGEQLIGEVVLGFEATYRTAENAPDSAI